MRENLESKARKGLNMYSNDANDGEYISQHGVGGLFISSAVDSSISISTDFSKLSRRQHKRSHGH